jgi:hypothetical protein
MQVDFLESELSNFSQTIRQNSFDQLLRYSRDGLVSCQAENNAFNLHCHTFFSFNAYGHSPTSLVWLALKLGWKFLGIVDFDTLDGVDELFYAGEKACLRTMAGIETRVFIPQFSDREINSPGEPGIAYHMGLGFISSHVPQTVAEILKDLRVRAQTRNESIIQKLNAYLDDIHVDFYRDVVPLSPSGTPTERHIVIAYLKKAAALKINEVDFWSKKLFLPPEKIQLIINDPPQMQNQVRSSLIKRGGPGYVQPTQETFPSVSDFHRLIITSGAIPTYAWLDGTSQGEKDIAELLDYLIQEGIGAVNIIPDRNWNIHDPELRKLKVENLNHFIQQANKLDLPINVGTEMNSFGNKIVDDFSVPELFHHYQTFLDGAYFIYGHSRLSQIAGLGYQSEWSKVHLPTRKQKNHFFATAGELIPPGNIRKEPYVNINSELTPEEILTILKKASYDR